MVLAQSDGRRLFVSLAQDITERRAHEEQVQLLMREVSHRAKNMLTLVHAIARQTAARQPEDFIKRFTERITSRPATIVIGTVKKIWASLARNCHQASFTESTT
jgi:hypothetical protein